MIYIYTERYTPRVKYIISHIFKRMLSDEVEFIKKFEEAQTCEGPLICYSRKETLPNAFNICPSGLVFQDGIRNQDIEVSEWNNTKIFFTSGDETYDLPFDIFSASFFLLSRYEEYYGEVDSFGRYKKEDSIAYKNGFLDQPIVDVWVKILVELLEKKIDYKFVGKNNYRVHSSVVIDNNFKYRFNSIFYTSCQLLKKLLSGNSMSFRHQLRIIFHIEEDPYDNFNYIFSFHNSINLTPTFFVLVKKGPSDCRNIYSFFKKLRKHLRRNYVTGLHPSTYSNGDVSKLKSELRTLEKRIVCQRVQTSLFHQLIFTLPKSFESLLKIGIREDYSMGYHNSLGFRAGTCTPFRFYDIKHESKTRLMINPLIISDIAFKGMGISHREIDAAAMPYIDKVKKYNGKLCMCVSNVALSDSGIWKGWSSQLQRIYKYASLLEVHDIDVAREYLV